MRNNENEHLIDDHETFLIALHMHPMFYRQPFKILRINPTDMKTDDLSPDILALKERFAKMPDAPLYAAWGAPESVSS